MRLPNGDKAYIPLRKLTDYLLSEAHSVGRTKARFFRSLGFDETAIEQLKQALLKIALTGQVKEKRLSPYGVKYVVDGFLETPQGATVSIRTIWIVETGCENPRFVTAYPIRGGK